ncbi:MAG: hypothetical protein KGP35_04555 [Bacteroidetes bacterium]|nr:hypothetical protein [Bacteroidota bacterium]
MGFKKWNRLLFLLVWYISGSFHKAAAQQTPVAQDFVVIGNDIGIKSVSSSGLTSIFRGKYSSWSNSQSAIIVLPSKKNPSAGLVALFLYKTSITGMQKFWLSQVFQGRSNAPSFLDSDEEIIDYVEKNPGAIGIIRKASVSSKLNPNRIILITN